MDNHQGLEAGANTDAMTNNTPRLWMRHEVRPTERRASIVPADARLLVEAGIAVTIAIDNLPSLLPREASVAFSADLLPHLKSLGSSAPPWQRCLRTFHAACDCVGVGVGK